MQLDPGLAIAVAIPLVGGLVWLVRLESRVRLLEEFHKDLKQDLSDIKGMLAKMMLNE